MKKIIVIISMLTLGFASCSKEPLTAPEMKYKHPVFPDRIPKDLFPNVDKIILVNK